MDRDALGAMAVLLVGMVVLPVCVQLMRKPAETTRWLIRRMGERTALRRVLADPAGNRDRALYLAAVSVSWITVATLALLDVG
jgi:hypothetical protein